MISDWRLPRKSNLLRGADVPSLRVLQILPSFSPAFGGPVRSALAVNEAYRRRHKVLAIGPGEAEGEWAERDTIGFRAFSLPFGPQHVSRFSPAMIRWMTRNVSAFDVVHLHFSRGLVTIPAAILGRLSSCRTIVQTHGMCEPWGGLLRYFDRVVTWPLLRAAATVLTLNEGESSRIREVGGNIDLRVVYNALLDRQGPSGRYSDAIQQPVRLLFCSRLHPRKRVDLYMEVLALLKSEGIAVRGLVVGNDEGALRGAQQMATRSGLDVQFTGTLGVSEVRRAMWESDALLHPAPREPFGMAMIEALAEGLPVVAAESSMLNGLFTSFGAVKLVPDEEIDVWVSSVKELLADDEARVAQVSGGFRLVEEKFTLDALAREIEAVLKGAFS